MTPTCTKNCLLKNNYLKKASSSLFGEDDLHGDGGGNPEVVGGLARLRSLLLAVELDEADARPVRNQPDFLQPGELAEQHVQPTVL